MFAANEIIHELEAYEGERRHDYDNVAIASDIIHAGFDSIDDMDQDDFVQVLQKHDVSAERPAALRKVIQAIAQVVGGPEEEYEAILADALEAETYEDMAEVLCEAIEADRDGQDQDAHFVPMYKDFGARLNDDFAARVDEIAGMLGSYEHIAPYMAEPEDVADMLIRAAM